jgi:excisionase family DNA binding protein
MDKVWMSYQEAMAYLSVCRSTLDTWRAAGYVTFAKLPSGTLRVRVADLDAFIESFLVEVGR